MIKKNNIQELIIDEVSDLTKFVIKENVKYDLNNLTDKRNTVLSLAKEKRLFYKNTQNICFKNRFKSNCQSIVFEDNPLTFM